MTHATNHGSNQHALAKPLPPSIVSGVLGLVFGGGLTFLGLYYLGYLAEQTPTDVAAASSGAPAGMSSGGMGGGMGGGGMGGGGMGGGGMGGGGMGGGMMGGGGGGAPRGKRNLTTLVAKLDLASKGIPFHLDLAQSSKLAEQLALLKQSEKMTQEEAQDRCDALEEMLSDEQKETLASFEMPRGGRGGGGGGGSAGGGPGAGGGGPGGMMAGGPSGPPGGGEPDEDNPFQEEANETRLRSLLDRLQGTPAGEADPASKQAEEGSDRVDS